MFNNKILGLTAAKTVGKDTFFKILKENSKYGIFERYAFADKLKLDLEPLCLNMFGISSSQLNSVQKEIIRPLYISYGCAWREIDILHWTKIVDNQIEACLIDINSTPVITDFRFESEADYFKQKYGDKFILVGLERAGVEPTDEEKKHIEGMRQRCNIIYNWQYDPTLEIPRKIVKQFCKTYLI